jgi:hypothetical protein
MYEPREERLEAYVLFTVQDKATQQENRFSVKLSRVFSGSLPHPLFYALFGHIRRSIRINRGGSEGVNPVSYRDKKRVNQGNVSRPQVYKPGSFPLPAPSLHRLPALTFE